MPSLNLIVDYARLAISHTVGLEVFTLAILTFRAQLRLPIDIYEQQSQSSLISIDLTTAERCKYDANIADLQAKPVMNTFAPIKIVSNITFADGALVYQK